MSLHPSTFEYLKPTDEQVNTMGVLRRHFADFALTLDALVPDGPDKTYIMRELRKIGFWANAAITRHPDGAPRT